MVLEGSSDGWMDGGSRTGRDKRVRYKCTGSMRAFDSDTMAVDQLEWHVCLCDALLVA